MKRIVPTPAPGQIWVCLRPLSVLLTVQFKDTFDFSVLVGESGHFSPDHWVGDDRYEYCPTVLEVPQADAEGTTSSWSWMVPGDVLRTTVNSKTGNDRYFFVVPSSDPQRNFLVSPFLIGNDVWDTDVISVEMFDVERYSSFAPTDFKLLASPQELLATRARKPWSHPYAEPASVWKAISEEG